MDLMSTSHDDTGETPSSIRKKVEFGDEIRKWSSTYLRETPVVVNKVMYGVCHEKKVARSRVLSPHVTFTGAEKVTAWLWQSRV